MRLLQRAREEQEKRLGKQIILEEEEGEGLTPFSKFQNNLLKYGPRVPIGPDQDIDADSYTWEDIDRKAPKSKMDQIETFYWRTEIKKRDLCLAEQIDQELCRRADLFHLQERINAHFRQESQVSKPFCSENHISQCGEEGALVGGTTRSESPSHIIKLFDCTEELEKRATSVLVFSAKVTDQVEAEKNVVVLTPVILDVESDYPLLKPLREVVSINSTNRRDKHQGLAIFHDGKKATYWNSKTRQSRPLGQNLESSYRILTWVGVKAGCGDHRDTKMMIYSENLEYNKGQLPQLLHRFEKEISSYTALEIELFTYLKITKESGLKVFFSPSGHTAHFGDNLKGVRNIKKWLNNLWKRHILDSHGISTVNYFFPPGVDTNPIESLLSTFEKFRYMYAIDKEGTGSRNKWGHMAFITLGPIAGLYFWESDECTLDNVSAYVKGGAREAQAVREQGKTLVLQEVDFLIPWEKEFIHSPLGGVLQISLRIIALMAGVIQMDFDYSSMDELIISSREGRFSSAAFVCHVGDVISLQKVYEGNDQVRDHLQIRERIFGS